MDQLVYFLATAVPLIFDVAIVAAPQMRLW
jgi:hypothetical protein